MTQAIITKYIGPSNTRGSRIIARCIVRENGVGGSLPNCSGYAFVFVGE